MADENTETRRGRRGREAEDSLDRRGKALLGDAGLDQPERVGPYKILERLGEGGMGTVYLAEQSEPIRRRVALKIIKLGMDTKEVVGRFEAERQALAMMNHPNVAKVFDAGATETGRPYFAMEHVPGVAITEYCDRERLTTKQRLDLFQQVCHAVQHAHQKGIIHRDIKPSNVLVMVQDGGPVPKVIDFGVAKAINQRLTEKTVFTEQGRLIGTPEYMSPEQAEMTAVDIDTRTDIYSLGVLLYELLVGTLPFERKALREAGYAAVQRIIRESEPPKPSTRLSSLGEDSSTISARRRSDPSTLARQIRGDLDWIVMKCLEKDRTRRYETPNALAMEIERHLNNEPVLAGPPSASYRMRKFIRRNRTGVAASGVVLVVLLAGITGTTWQAVIATHQRDRAELAEEEQIRAREEADKAREEAEDARDQTQVVVDFQSSMLGDVDAELMGIRLTADLGERLRESLERQGLNNERLQSAMESFEESLRSINATDAALKIIDENFLARAVETIEKEFADQPLVESALRQAIAGTYHDLGMYRQVMPQQERVLEIRRRALGDDHPRTLASINNMGYVLRSMGKHAEAEPYYREALEGRRRVLGNDHPETLFSINNMGELLGSMGKGPEAELYYREALEGRRRVLGDDHPDTLSSISNLGSLLAWMGKHAEAEPHCRAALEGRRRVLGDDDPFTLSSINNMGMLLESMGKLAEAQPYFREALEGLRRARGDDHSETLTSINNMGMLLESMGKLAEAEPYLREALEGSHRVLGDDHPDTLRSINNMGFLLKSMGKLAEAELYYREALEGSRRVLGDDNPQTLMSIHNMGGMLRDRGRLEEAEALGAEAVRGVRAKLAPFHPFRLAALAQHGRTLAAMQRFTEAQAELLEAYEGYIETRGDEDELTIGAVKSLSDLYTAWHEADPDQGYDATATEWRTKLPAADLAAYLISRGNKLVELGKHSDAEPLLRECLKIREEVLAEDHWLIFNTMSTLGAALAGQEKFAEAEPLLIDGYEQMKPPTASLNRKQEALDRIIAVYDTWHAAEPEEGYDAKAAQWRAKLEMWQATTQPASQPASAPKP